MIRAYLLDDEEHALNILEILLSEIGGVDVVGRATNPFEALEAIRKLKPDVVFLDIEMPGMYGVELAERIHNDALNTAIVFVTAHNDYAIAAFEQGTLDYLLKPLEESRLLRTVQRIRIEMTKSRVLASRVIDEAFQLKVCTFGGFEVLNEQGVKLKWRTAKVKELFAFFLLQDEAGVHRDRIIDKLWPNDNYHKAKIYLHTCVSYLRKDFKKAGIKEIIQYNDEKYYLNKKSIACDYYSLKSGIMPASEFKNEQTVKALEEAHALYSGPLLENCDYTWVFEEREYIHKKWMDSRLSLAEYFYHQGEHRKAIETAEQLLLVWQYDEEIYLLIMNCYRAIGKHDEVSRIYQSLVRALKELQVEPMEATKRRYGK